MWEVRILLAESRMAAVEVDKGSQQRDLDLR
jgi:hypothetical protein